MKYEEIKKNKEVLAFIKKGNENLGIMGYTDHSEAHGCLVAERAARTSLRRLTTLKKKWNWPKLRDLCTTSVMQ